MVEDTELVSTVDGTSEIANEEKEVEILVQVPPQTTFGLLDQMCVKTT